MTPSDQGTKDIYKKIFYLLPFFTVARTSTQIARDIPHWSFFGTVDQVI